MLLLWGVCHVKWLSEGWYICHNKQMQLWHVTFATEVQQEFCFIILHHRNTNITQYPQTPRRSPSQALTFRLTASNSSSSRKKTPCGSRSKLINRLPCNPMIGSYDFCFFLTLEPVQNQIEFLFFVKSGDWKMIRNVDK